MKTNVAQTSLLAYYEIENDGRLTDKRKLIIRAVHELGTACAVDISLRTGLPINTVSGQVNWLVKEKYLGVDHVAISKTGFRAKFLKVLPR